MEILYQQNKQMVIVINYNNKILIKNYDKKR